MPKRTFYNLSNEKRLHIEGCALEEFAMYPFEKVSISRIVERAGIAKGSFYQYFEGKIDLAAYLLEVIAEAEIAYIEKNMSEVMYTSDDFIEWLRQQMDVSIQFALSNIDIINAYRRLMIADVPALNEKLMEVTGRVGVGFYTKKIKGAMDAGYLRNDLSAEFLGHYVVMVMFSLLDDYLREEVPEGGTISDGLSQRIAQSIDVLENGIKHRGG
ncbi:MAG: TetR/AcrR family transcriptional regulator [Clostridia bacterium]|nr:TetR/AcrR family transcriptional regulator [Clostridia bacterium]